MRKPGTAEEWERVRNVAANMVDRGDAPAAIAVALGVAAQTVRQWRRAYRAGGRAALASGRASGRPPRLTDDQRERLGALLDAGPTPAACGLAADKYLWTQQLVADLILREFGAAFHHDHVGVLLKEIGFTHQKPRRRAAERDESKIEGWRRETWPGLLKKTPRPTG
jgi:transposase